MGASAVMGASAGAGASAALHASAGAPAWLSLRSRAAARLAARLPPDVAPTALALLLAERDEVDPELRRRFAAAGLAHLLAISGMHVGLLTAGLVALLGTGLGPRRRLPLALAVVAAYVVLIGAPPAARRALVIIAGWTWARLRGWPAREGELAGAALLAAVVAAPGSLTDPGLQLSFAGYAGVIAGGRAGRTLWPGASRPARGGRAAAVSVGALLATSPITALHFGQVTPASLPAHFVGAPLVAVALGSLPLLLAVPDALAPPVAAVATGALRTLHAAAGVFADLPGGHRAVPPPALVLWLAWAALLVGLRGLVVTGRLRPLGVSAALAAGLVSIGPVAATLRNEPALLCTLSVGQGDAAVLRTRSGRWFVFDGGPASPGWDAGTAIVVPFLRRHRARSVDVAVLSHPDLDHLGGLRGVLGALPVRRLLDTGDAVPSGAYAEFLESVDAAHVHWLPAAAGDRLSVDGVELLVLGPAREPGTTPLAAGDANATSLSFRLTIGDRFRYVNTGDAHAAEESELLAHWGADSLRADVLKVGHHGSRTSSRVDWLRAVRPALAVISAGASNRYGHPHAVTLARLDSAAVPRLWRTDREGTLCVEVDRGGRWRIRGEATWREPAAATRGHAAP
jgi:competence protein ComEC